MYGLCELPDAIDPSGCLLFVDQSFLFARALASHCSDSSDWLASVLGRAKCVDWRRVGSVVGSGVVTVGVDSIGGVAGKDEVEDEVIEAAEVVSGGSSSVSPTLIVRCAGPSLKMTSRETNTWPD